MKSIACKPVAIFLQFTLLLTFSYSVAFSLKISILMWKLNNDLGALANNVNGHAIGMKEVIYHVIIWSFCIFSVAMFLAYQYMTDSSIEFATHQYCVVTKDNGMLFMVVVPTAITVSINLICVIYSSKVLFSMLISRPVFDDSNNNVMDNQLVKKLFSFLARLISFQSTLWLLGLIYYISGNEIFGLLFEVFASFEGLVLFISLMSSIQTN